MPPNAADGSEERGRYAARLAGAFRLTGPDGADVLPRSRRTRALLAYLILTPPHVASREMLAALLWSERGEEQARGSLRQALFELRPLVGPERLLGVSRAEVRLYAPALATDLLAFDRAAEEEDLTTMAMTFGEPDAVLLGDMREVDPAFDEWLAHQRMRWIDARRASALRACQGAAALRAPAPALRLAKLVALADPLDETAAIAVMTRAQAGGDVGAVRRTFTLLSEALRRELGVGPTRATVAAYERLATMVEPLVPDQARVRPREAAPRRRASGWRVAVGAGAAIAAAIALPVALDPVGRAGSGAPAAATAAGKPAKPLPDDPAAAALFVEARDDAAQRTTAGLDEALSELQRVTRLQPRFAPGYAALADAYLLAGEAGSLSKAVAFDGAGHAADRAQLLDPQLSAPHRARGFMLYWWQHRAASAGEEFRQAIRTDPDDALTRFWYANVLADAGQQAAAMREFGRARLADPGSDQIGADYAWALWAAGRDDEARARLDAIILTHPDNVEAINCAATLALARGDGAAFLVDHRRVAALRGEPALAADDRLFAAAFRRGGAAALLEALVSRVLTEQQDAPYPDRSEAAFYASLGHDREALLRVLTLAATAHERWGAAGYLRRVRAAWAGDPVVLAAIQRLAGDRVE